MNNTWELAPWADALYACDYAWWAHYGAHLHFRGAKWTQDKIAAKQFAIKHIPLKSESGFSYERDVIHGGGNSGFQAVNLAIHHGAKEIGLLGFDMKLGEGGKRHFFGDHPGAMNKQSSYTSWIKSFGLTLEGLAEHGVRVTNCTKGSALNVYPFASLEDFLK